MEQVQEASWHFFVPLLAAYGAAIGGWMLVTRLWPGTWPKPLEIRTERKWLDFELMFAGVAALAAVSAMHRAKLLLPQPAGCLGSLTWNVNVLLIYSPVFVIPLLRRQSLESIYLSARRLGTKVFMGLGLGFVSVVLFYVLRGEPQQLGAWAARAASPALFAKYFLAIFMEGVALAFVLVRIKWALGFWPALLVPSLLFALFHVPNSINAGESWTTIIAFFMVNTALVSVILYVVQKSQDVIWLGIPHYLMDIAIRAIS